MEKRWKKNYTQILQEVDPLLEIPIMLKIHHYFSGMSNMIWQLAEHQRVQSIVMFNRFYNPDIDIKRQKIINPHVFSQPSELSLPLCWTGIMADKINADIAISSGIHDGEAVVKGLLAGAKATQVATAFYQRRPEFATEMNNFLHQWMNENGYETIKEFRGNLAQKNIANPALFERTQCMKYFSSYE